MYEVNRSVVILRPKQPFLDWLKTLPGHFEIEPTLTTLRENSNALLVPPFDNVDELKHFIAQHCIELFQAELADWCEDGRQWPQILTPSLFDRWFDLELHSVATDLVETPLEREHFFPLDLGHSETH